MYFKTFSRVLYPFADIDPKVVFDITKNVRFKKDFLRNLNLYEYYYIEDGDTPELISEKFYGEPYYHWLIMLLNERYDHINDFPLSDVAFQKYMAKKYRKSDLSAHHFEDTAGNVITGYCYLTLSKKCQGTISIKKNSLMVYGKNTNFVDDCLPGNILYNNSGYPIAIVQNVISNTKLVIANTVYLDYNNFYSCKPVIEIGTTLTSSIYNDNIIGDVVVNKGNDKYKVILSRSCFYSNSTAKVYDNDNIYRGFYNIDLVEVNVEHNIISNLAYEYDINEKKKMIKMIPKIYLPQILDELIKLS